MTTRKSSKRDEGGGMKNNMQIKKQKITKVQTDSVKEQAVSKTSRIEIFARYTADINCICVATTVSDLKF